MNIFLIHQYSGNKGDRAVLYAMCRLIMSIYPQAKISVATSDASMWNGYSFYKENNISFTPWAWDFQDVSSGSYSIYWKFLSMVKKYNFTIFRESFLRGIDVSGLLTNPQFRKSLKDADVVISVGGHHFTTILSRDLVSGINYDSMAVLSAKKKLICFSQSFGPFNFYNSRNKRLTKRILGGSYLMPKEDRSKSDLESFVGSSFQCAPTYESVLSLSHFIDYVPVNNRDNTVGIAIYCTQYRDKVTKQKYVNDIAGFCNHVISKGFNVRFFPMEIKGTEPDDRPFICEIISHVVEKNKCLVVNDDLETLAHLNEVSKCKVFLGHKTHSTIFALATGTPLIGLAYHPKTIEFLTQFGLKSNVIDDREMSSKRLIDIFDKLNVDLETVGLSEYSQSKEFAKQIFADFQQAVTFAIN